MATQKLSDKLIDLDEIKGHIDSINPGSYTSRAVIDDEIGTPDGIDRASL